MGWRLPVVVAVGEHEQLLEAREHAREDGHQQLGGSITRTDVARSKSGGDTLAVVERRQQRPAVDVRGSL